MKYTDNTLIFRQYSLSSLWHEVFRLSLKIKKWPQVRKSGNPKSEIRKSEIRKSDGNPKSEEIEWLRRTTLIRKSIRKSEIRKFNTSFPKEKTTVFYPGGSDLFCWLLCTRKFFWGKNFPKKFSRKLFWENNFPVLGSSTSVRGLTFVTNTFQELVSTFVLLDSLQGR